MLLGCGEKTNAKYIFKIMYFVRIHTSDFKRKTKRSCIHALTSDVPSLFGHFPSARAMGFFPLGSPCPNYLSSFISESHLLDFSLSLSQEL